MVYKYNIFCKINFVNGVENTEKGNLGRTNVGRC